jgi:uncharacterized membrane protein YsdA (DUF1294 family)/cold shock CspA family protein
MLMEGELRVWNDDKGFGFIRVGPGQPDVFLHISALPPGMRPQAGDRILFSTVSQVGGKGPRAHGALVQGRQPDPAAIRRTPAPASRQPRTAPPARRADRLRDMRLRSMDRSPAVFLAMVLAVFCLAGAVSFVPVSPIPLFLYPAASLVAFVLYGKDKYRALTGAWRISEATLHLTEALGGWPGAFVAQRTMRHKTVKAEYQATFWLIAAAHVGFWGLWLWSPETILSALPPGARPPTLEWTGS